MNEYEGNSFFVGEDIMIKVDIAMTAVIRPSLLKETLEKIVGNVVDIPERFRLIINVDPIGEEIAPIKVVETAQKYFNDVVYNIAPKPSFPKAVRWVWNASTAPYVFHWEDDVFILRKIDIKDMINILERHKEISSLRLFKHDTPRKGDIKAFRSSWQYNKKGFYVAKRWQEQFGLNPVLIKSAFVKEAVPLMREDRNPEKQFRYNNPNMEPLIKKWKYALYTKPGDKALVWGKKGQTWKNRHGFYKSKIAFIEWNQKTKEKRK